MKKLVVSGLIGSIFGVIGSRFIFVGSALSLIPWGITGLIIGFWSKSAKEAVLNGSVYGFLLSFIFMVSGYSGSAALLSRIPFFIILGIVGAICGGVLGIIGNLLRKFR